MQRIPIDERPDWRQRAEQDGFLFHSIHGEPYWDETAYYAFTLKEIEDDLEAPTAALEAMCRELVAGAVADERIFARLAIPERFWNFIAASWKRGDGSLYGRFDLRYDGNGPAKLVAPAPGMPAPVTVQSAPPRLQIDALSVEFRSKELNPTGKNEMPAGEIPLKPMSAADYFLPPELGRTIPQNTQVLLVGQCLLHSWSHIIERKFAGCTAEHLLYNNLSKLPERTADEIRQYAFQVISIPARAVFLIFMILVS